MSLWGQSTSEEAFRVPPTTPDRPGTSSGAAGRVTESGSDLHIRFLKTEKQKSGGPVSVPHLPDSPRREGSIGMLFDGYPSNPHAFGVTLPGLTGLAVDATFNGKRAGFCIKMRQLVSYAL